MISVQEARNKIFEELFLLPVLRTTLDKSLFRVLARDIKAPIPLPLYDNSAMDGFAVKSADLLLASPVHPASLPVRGTQRAGDPPSRLPVGAAIRIMTGATIPKGADAVIRKEEAEEKEGRIFITGPVPSGANLRRKGEEIRKGSLVLPAGAFLTSRSVGLLANLGLSHVPTRQAPKVALIITGSELILPREKRRHGRIYDSNTPMLLSALREIHLEALRVKRVSDDERKLENSIRRALEDVDVLLLVGGVSVGDYDFSKSVLSRLGVKTIFWKVAQKPGMPLYFGKKGKKLIFGVPGNPVSAWVCFHEYMRPALWGLQGIQNLSLVSTPAILKKTLKADPFKTLFLRGRVQQNNGHRIVAPLNAQGSHMLKALAEAGCLLQVPPGKGSIPQGSEVEIHPLPEGRMGDFL